MANVVTSNLQKYLALENLSGSADSEAPDGGVYLFASGAVGSAKLFLQNEGGSIIDLEKSLDIDAFDELDAAPHATQDEFLVSDNGTEKRVSMTHVAEGVFALVTGGDATINSAGAVTIANGAVETAMLANDAVDADKLASNAVVNASIASNAAIDLNKIDGGSADNSLSDLAQTDLLYAGDVDASNEIKKITFSDFEDAIFGNVTGEIAISAGGATVVSDNVIDESNLKTSVAGDGLAGGNGTALSVAVSGGVEIANDKLGIVAAFAGDGLAASGSSTHIGGLSVNVDDSSIEINSDALRVKASGVTNAMLAGSIADSKLNAISSANKVEASALELSSNTALEDDAGLALKANIAGDGLAIAESGGNQILSVGVDDSSLEINSDALRVKASGVTNAMLAGSITAAKMNNAIFADLETLGAASADGEFIVATGAGAFAYESGNTARTSLGLGTGDSPSFTGVTVSGLTAGRIPFAGTGGALSDEANLQYSAAANSIVLDGHLSGSGNMQFDGSVITGGNHNISGSALIGPGGYSGTGVTITSGGNISGKGNLTVNGTAQFAGGYGNGDGGVDITSTGGLNMDGNFRSKGNFEVGTAGESGNSVKFHGDSANHYIQYDADKLIFTQDDGSSNHISIGGNGNNDYAVDVAQGSANNKNKIRAAAFVTYSDENLKSDVKVMNSALDTVMSLEGVEFTWKDSGERDFGFIAQDVQSVLPKAVHTAGDGVQGVDYSRLTSVLVEAVKAQQVQIEELKALLKK